MNHFERTMHDAINRAPIVTLLTDFGQTDGYVGVMKGVLLSLAPGVTLVDISHDLPPQSIHAGAFLQRWSYSYFPAGTIHLAVVDPGVGTTRGMIAMEASGHRFVGPDNGLLYPTWQDLLNHGSQPHVVDITNRNYWLERIAPTFHGRDIFSPVTAHLANGLDLEALGPALQQPRIALELPTLKVSDDAIRGEVIYIDRFGNLITNLVRFQVESWLQSHNKNQKDSLVVLKDLPLRPIGGSYSDSDPGDVVITFDGYDMLEIAVNQGSAEEALDAVLGSPVRLECR